MGEVELLKGPVEPSVAVDLIKTTADGDVPSIHKKIVARIGLNY
jgi:hypothetical protein